MSVAMFSNLPARGTLAVFLAGASIKTFARVLPWRQRPAEA